MNESEAKTKWCPMAFYPMEYRVNCDPAFAANVSDDGKPAVNCIGSDCMMFRSIKKPIDMTATGGITIPDYETIYYCGLAGKP